MKYLLCTLVKLGNKIQEGKSLNLRNKNISFITKSTIIIKKKNSGMMTPPPPRSCPSNLLPLVAQQLQMYVGRNNYWCWLPNWLWMSWKDTVADPLRLAFCWDGCSFHPVINITCIVLSTMRIIYLYLFTFTCIVYAQGLIRYTSLWVNYHVKNL